MDWHYKCPNCGSSVKTEWEKARHEVVCPHCRHRHFPPTPSEDHTAYVGSDRWPKDIEEVVLALRGTSCSVRECFREHTTLVHRRSATKGGHTSVDNLLPMCAHHAREMGLEDYDDWIKTLPASAATQQPTIQITLTSQPKSPAAAATGIQMTHGAGSCQTIAAAGPAPDAPPDLRLVTHTVFVPGPARWVVLKYDWRFKQGESLGVFLLAWPQGQEPSFSAPTGGKSLVAADNHFRKDGEAGSSRLQLAIRPTAEQIWNAAVYLKNDSDPATLERYALFAAD